VQDSADRYDSILRTFKTHLMISSGTCQADPPLVSKVLMDQERERLAGTSRTEWQELADRQIQFYATELKYGNPSPVPDGAAGF